MFQFLVQSAAALRRGVTETFGGGGGDDGPAPRRAAPLPADGPPGEPAPDQAPDPARMSELAGQLYHAMDGLGTDEDAALSALRGRNPAEVAEMRRVYQQRFGRPLEDDLASELSGDDLEVARAALTGDPVDAAATALAAATDGMGTDEDAVLATLGSITDPEQRRAVADEVRRRTGRSLDALLDEELSGPTLEAAQLLQRGAGPDAEAARLEDAMQGLGTDEETIRAVLQSSHDREALLEAYRARTGRALQDDLCDELGGDEQTLATALAEGDRVGAAAAQVHLAADGPGTDEKLMRDALQGMNPDLAAKVRERYQLLYGVDLDEEISSELSGREKREVQLLLPEEAGPSFGSAEFDKMMNQATGSTARGGNRMTMLFDGVNSFAERDRLIDQATESINLQTFIFTDDDTGWGMAARLAAKADQGVKVRLIYDGLGSQPTDPKIFDYMREHGVEVRAYARPIDDPLKLNARWHEKHLIVDGQTSIEGGMNIANEYAQGGTDKPVATRGNSEAWRDADIEMTGPAVADAQAAFLRNWGHLGEDVPASEQDQLMRGGAAAEGGAGVRVVQHLPDEEGDDHIEKMYLQCIKSSRTSITIENAYFIPSDAIMKELMAAAKRGVAVKVMTNSRESNDNHAGADASRYYYDELVAAGVKMYEKQGGTLHAKTAAFDGEYSIVGSANLNGRSREHDAEVVLGIQDAGVAHQLEDRFADGMARTRNVTAADLGHESTWTDTRQWAASFFSGVF